MHSKIDFIGLRLFSQTLLQHAFFETSPCEAEAEDGEDEGDDGQEAANLGGKQFGFMVHISGVDHDQTLNAGGRGRGRGGSSSRGTRGRRGRAEVPPL